MTAVREILEEHERNILAKMSPLYEQMASFERELAEIKSARKSLGAQAIEARSGETGTGSTEGESAVRKDAPKGGTP